MEPIGARPRGHVESVAVQHIGIVACSAEGAALCYQAICREALTRVGKNDHPRITMDSIPLATWMPPFDAGDYRGADAVALACTEIPLLVTPDVSSLPTLDSTRLLASAALTRAIG